MTPSPPDISPSKIEWDDSPIRYRSARAHARALVVQGLYALRLSSNSAEQVQREIEARSDFRSADREYFHEAWAKIAPQIGYLEAVYTPFLDRSIDELSPIERSIMTLATWEMESRIDVPYKVVMNEAVELAKRFGGTDGHRFVNGVLDKLAPQLRAPEVNAGRQN